MIARSGTGLGLESNHAGLPPEETRVMTDLITALAAERAVILAEHMKKLVMGICERLLVLRHGECRT